MSRRETTLKAVKEQNIAKALAGLADGTYSTVNQAIVATGAPKTTLYDRKHGRKTRREANVHRQALAPNEEQALVKWVERLSCTGHPVRHTFLRELAEEIRKPRVEHENYPVSPLGKQWVTRFLHRHPSLKSKVAKSIETARKEVTEEQIQHWFATFKRVIEDNNILPENIYNMDETGLSLQFSLLIIGFNIGVRGQNA